MELNDKKLLNNILSYLLDIHKNISTTIQDFFVPEELFIKKNLVKVLKNNQDEELYVDFKSKYKDYGKVLTKIEI